MKTAGAFNAVATALAAVLGLGVWPSSAQYTLTWNKTGDNGNWSNVYYWDGKSNEAPDEPDEQALFRNPSGMAMPIQNDAMNPAVGQVTFEYTGWIVYDGYQPLKFKSQDNYGSNAINAYATGGAGTITLYPGLEFLNARQTIQTATGATLLITSKGVGGSYAPIISSFNPTSADTGAVKIEAASTVTDAFVVRQGTLLVAHNSALGSSTASVAVGDSETTAGANARLLTDASGITIPKNIVVSNISGHEVNATFGSNHTSGASAFSGSITANRDITLTAAGGSTCNFNGTIAGAGGVTKTGTGTVGLNAANSFNGAVSIQQGTLRLGAAGAIPANRNVTLANTGGAELDLNGYAQTIGALNGGGASGGWISLGSATLTVASGTFNGIITGSGSLRKTGGGVLTLSAAQWEGGNSYSGGTTIEGGTVRLAWKDALPVSGAVTLANTAGAQLDLNGNPQTIGALNGGGADGGNISLGSATLRVHSGTYNGAISGTGSLQKITSGTLVLGGANSYGGGTTIDAGTLQLGPTGNLPVGGDLSLNGGLFDLNGRSQSVGNLTGGGNIALGGGALSVASGDFNGVIAGNGNLTKTGSGTLKVNGANTFSGTTIISGGTLQTGAPNALPAGGDVSVANAAGATLDLNGFSQTIGALNGGGTLGGVVALGGATLTVASGTFSGVVSGVGELVKTGPGTLVLGGNNTYSGQTKVQGGTLQVGNGGTRGAIVTDVQNDGTLSFNRSDTVVFDRAISGSGGLSKYGEGLLTLNGTLTYSGPTDVYGGVLWINSALQGGGTVTVHGPMVGAGAQLGGIGSVAGSVLVQTNASLAPGNSIGTFSVLGNVDLQGTLHIELEADRSDLLQVGGELSIGGGEVSFKTLGPLTSPVYVIASYGALNGEFRKVNNLPPGYSLDYNYLGLNQIALVPEPSVALFALVAGVLAARSRRRISERR